MPNHSGYEMVTYEQEHNQRGSNDNLSTASTSRPQNQDKDSHDDVHLFNQLRRASKQPDLSTQPYDEFKGKEFGRHSTGLSSSFTKRLSFKPRHSTAVHFLRDWWLELISCFFLIGGLIAIIVTAREYQDQPLPNLPHGLSINSVFAIYVVILKAAMLLILAQGLSHLKWTWFQKTRPLNDLARYDNASRGPLGSIWLLITLRGRDIIASIGALIIVGAVILDPMAQQVIRYYNCPRPLSTTNATLPRTNAYMERGAHISAGQSTIPTTLQSAINGGVFVPGSQVGSNCLTGNCTFQEQFHTVGFASQCVDVSDQLVFQNVSVVSNTTMQQYDDSGNVQTVPVTSNYTSLNATLPSGLSTSYNQFSADVSFMVMAYNLTTSSVEIILGPQVLDPLAPHNPYCTGSAYDNVNKSTDWLCRGYGAARCTLDPAIYTISSATIKSGILQESISFATSLTTDISSSSLVDVSCLSMSQINDLKAVGYDIPIEMQWLPYNVSLDLSGNLTSSSMTTSDSTIEIAPKECIYQVYPITANSIASFFTDFFSGAIIPSGSEYTGPTVLQQFYNGRSMTFSTVNEMFNNITMSMTTYIRQHGFANNSLPALGQVNQTETCIRVRWPLIAYPAILTVMTLLFFVSMVATTTRAQQGVHHDFKSSPLALLFHGLEEDVQKRLERVHAGESNEVGDLKEEAKGMMVKLRPTGKGWRFVLKDSNDVLRT